MTGPQLQIQSEKLTIPYTTADVTLCREEVSRCGLYTDTRESAAPVTPPASDLPICALWNVPPRLSAAAPPRATSAPMSQLCTRVHGSRVGSFASAPESPEWGCLSLRQSLCGPWPSQGLLPGGCRPLSPRPPAGTVTTPPPEDRGAGVPATCHPLRETGRLPGWAAPSV